MGLFDDLFGSDKKKGQQAFGLFSFMNDQQNEDREIDSYGLEDWQKDEIKKGNNDPWGFEEEEMEEDDYYYEDDE